jgi:hypothetical protein
MNSIAIQKIRELQEAEGNKPCFRSGKLECPHEYSCCWSELCDFEMSRPKAIHKFEVN